MSAHAHDRPARIERKLNRLDGVRQLRDRRAATRATPDALRLRVRLAAVLAVPVVLAAMVPPLPFPGRQWVSLVLATPVVTWATWPRHRAALANLRHRSATMDTLGVAGAAIAPVELPGLVQHPGEVTTGH